MFPLFFFVLGLIGAGIHILRSKKRSKEVVIETLLVYLMVFTMGIGTLFGALFQIFQPVDTAAKIGWAPSPFEFEVGMSNVGIAVASLMAIFWRGRYLLGPIIASTIFIYGAAYGHFVQMSKGDIAPYNSGIFLYTADIIFPTVILILAILYYTNVIRTSKS